MEGKVFSVETVCFNIQKSSPPQLIVHAAGTVNSSGWSDGRLIPWSYVDVPQDGIADFDFIATAPSGTVLWVMTPIPGSVVMQQEPWLKGIRVHSATSSKEILISDGTCEAHSLNVALETWPWPWIKEY